MAHASPSPDPLYPLLDKNPGCHWLEAGLGIVLFLGITGHPKIPMGTPLAVALNTERKICNIFDRNLRLSPKRYEIGPRLP